MRFAWVDPPNVIRDLAPVGANPAEIYHSGVAALYSTEVPDGVAVGAVLAGGVWVNPEPASPGAFTPPPDAVPQSVTPLQARKALRAAGLIDAVETYIATQSAAIQDEWEYAVQIERNNPAIAAAGPALGLTDAQIDDLFRLAATL